ncbi:MAG: cupredoxin domain-containing protein [Alphaproteobacteria bacterium]|nr:cupredoxin domain-containing protein [Alphaproteobacteria bacterium]
MTSRRTTLRWLIAAPAVAGLAAAGFAAEPPVREIRITARRFEYTPASITARRGETVDLLLTSEDRIHGFKMPDFNLRADILPGQITTVRLMLDRTGSFAFFCDVFCGDGHEEMGGTILVEA